MGKVICIVDKIIKKTYILAFSEQFYIGILKIKQKTTFYNNNYIVIYKILCIIQHK